jgi:pyruvate dehydrogenase E2 component (dihydrolipoamide acetyltransferase)
VTELIEVRVPDIGEYKDVEIIEVAVHEGEVVALDATLLTLETEKATMDVPTTAAGVVRSVKVQRGGRVSQGDVIAVIEATTSAQPARPAAHGQGGAAVAPASGESREPSPRPAAVVAAASSVPAAVRPPMPAPVEAAVPDQPGFSRSHASPSIRRFARDLGVDLASVPGTGVKGRITEQDVKAHVKRLLTTPVPAPAPALPRVPEVDFAAFGPIERKPLSRIQKIAGPRLHASWVNIPHVTQFDEADITEMEATRARMKGEAAARGIKLTPLAFVMRACVQALAAFPRFCASLDAAAGELVFRRYVHLGFAADTPGGLVVPVVRDADKKDVFELARELAVLSEKARAGKLTAAEMQGGCFTISSLGGIGGTAFTPIINAPELAILGVSKASHRPVYQDGAFVPRLMLPLSLSYDHRVIDGADAARFTSFLGQALADVQGLLGAAS